MSQEEAVDELLAALNRPGVFRAVVDSMEPSVAVTILKMWGVAHGHYPPDPIPPPQIDALREYGARLREARRRRR